MKIIDSHCHFLTSEYITALNKFNRSNEDGFPTPKWNLEMQLAYMEKCHIDHAILSLSTPHPYFSDDKFSVELVRSINEFASSLTKKYSNKFSFAACLPLPNLELSLAEARYALEHLGACSIKIASQSNGLYLGNAILDPLMAYLNEEKVVIIIHPSKPMAVPKGCFSSGPMPLLEFINDTTRAVINLIVSGTLERYPDLRILIPHCGSFLPNVIDRLAGITKLFMQKGIGKPINIEKSLKNLYFDLAGDAFPRNITILSTLADTNHILFGGDFPYTPVKAIERKIHNLNNYLPFAEDLDKIYYKNASKLFRII